MFLRHELLQTLRDDMCDLGSVVGESSGQELTGLTNRSSGLECKDGQSQVREWEHGSEIHEKLVELVRKLRELREEVDFHHGPEHPGPDLTGAESQPRVR